MAQRRRSYLVVRPADGRQIRVLAYSAEYAQNYAARRGYVFAGPAPQRRVAGAELPPNWAVNEAGLAAYCREIGLAWDVRITRTAARGRGGRHQMTLADFGRRHRITADKRAHRNDAERALRHELEHARQAEQFSSWSAFLAEHRRQRTYPYNVRPIEIEARAAEDKLPAIQLTREP